MQAWAWPTTPTRTSCLSHADAALHRGGHNYSIPPVDDLLLAAFPAVLPSAPLFSVSISGLAPNPMKLACDALRKPAADALTSLRGAIGVGYN